MRERGLRIELLLSALLLLGASRVGAAEPWGFEDVTEEAGLLYQQSFEGPVFDMVTRVIGGVAAGDYDRDGFVDLYVVRGSAGPNLLFRNRGDGGFDEVAAEAGAALSGIHSSALFADLDGDGWQDLLVLGVAGTPPVLLRNDGEGGFEDETAGAGLATDRAVISAAAGDYDLDGDLDLFLSHWGSPEPGDGESPEYLWRNDGDGGFTDVSLAAQLPFIGRIPSDDLGAASLDLSFSPSFSDVDGDGWPDILVAADFGESRVLRNDRDGSFSDMTTPVMSDENGMGSAIGDFDGDGDLDWFVSSIYDPNQVAEENWGISGNRLYRNEGGFVFSDATDEEGVRHGFWGWGSSFGDFDNDGNLDLYHVNGWYDASDEFTGDPARLFVARGDGGPFQEQAAARGVDDMDQGRGVVVFDYDRDGDLDLFLSQNLSEVGGRLYRNDGGNAEAWLTVRLESASEDVPPLGVGARVEATTASGAQVRELRAGSNYVSQNPSELHFGLGSATELESLEVSWRPGRSTRIGVTAVNQCIVVEEEGSEVRGCGGGRTCEPASCDDGDACTVDRCEDGSCSHAQAVGVASASCACDRPAPASCYAAGALDRVLRYQRKACRRLEQAEGVEPGRSKKLREAVGRAKQPWKKALRALESKRSKRALSRACRRELGDHLRDARARTRQLLGS